MAAKKPLRRLDISLKKQPAMQAHRVVLGHLRLVYVLVASKRIKYGKGRSRIAYIGTTKNGSARVAQSVASRASAILGMHGVTSFTARIVTCRPRQNVKSWRKLERALILTFKEVHGEIPKCNVQGKNMSWTDELDYFAAKRLRAVIDGCGQP